MKTLYLLRHAKSSREDINVADFDRPLSARGKRDALMMGWVIKNLHIYPDLILCSPAKRTRSTIKRIGHMSGWWQEILYFDERLYEISLQSLLYVVSSFDDSKDEVMIVWHNPWLTQLCQSFECSIDEIKPGGLVKIVFDVKWRNDYDAKTVKNYSYLDPKKIFAILWEIF